MKSNHLKHAGKCRMQVTYIIPTKNRPITLVRAVKSILNQSPESEIVIVNDGGDPLAVEQEIGKINSDRILLLHNNKSRGAPFSRNIGASYAKTEILAFLDDDDEILSNKDELTYLLIKTGADVAYGQAILINHEGNKSGVVGSDIIDIAEVNPIPSPSFIVKTRMFREVKGYTLSAKSCQDWDLYIKILNKSGKFVFHEVPVALHYEHDGIRISKNMYRYYLGRYGLIFRHSSFFIKRKGIYFFLKSFARVLVRRFP